MIRALKANIVIGPPGAVKVTVATEPVDLRQGAEGLVAGVRETMWPIALAVRSMSSVPNAGSNRSGWGEATVLGATFFLTIFRDLTEAIVVGFALGSVLFIHRMSRTTAVATHTPFVSRDEADTTRPLDAYDEELAANPDVVVYRITGALFFGATASIGSVLDRIQDSHKALIVDFSAVPFLDSTGANMIEGLAHKAHQRHVALWLTGASDDIRRVLITHGLKQPIVHYASTVSDAVAKLLIDKQGVGQTR